MGYSNVISLFIIVTTAATLNAHGVTDIQTSAQAAEALRPIAGVFTLALLPSGSSAMGCLRCRCWPDPARMRSARRWDGQLA